MVLEFTVLLILNMLKIMKEIKLNKEEYKYVLMLRVNTEKIRQSLSFPKDYILESSTDKIRPYRILLKN